MLAVGDVLLVLLFLYVLCSIVGMTLFGGALRTRCVTQAEADAFAGDFLTGTFDEQLLKTYDSDPGALQLKDSSTFFWWDKNTYDIGDIVSCPVSINCPACSIVAFSA